MRASRVLRAGVVCATLALAACQTASNQAYEAALKEKTADPAEVVVEEEKAPIAVVETQRDGPMVPQTSADYFDQFSTATVQPQERPSDPGSMEAGLWLLTDRAEKQARTSGNRIHDPNVHDYVAEIVCRVAEAYCNDIRVYVMRVPAFNASQFPNGMMNVWSGLLLRAENEAQAAAVIGHEIGHYLRRHSVQRHRDRVARSDGLMFIGLMVGTTGFGSVTDLMQVMSAMGMQAFSREHEREADGWGAVLMSQAGYDASEAAKIWNGLMEEFDFVGIDRVNNAFSSHPPSEERQAALTQLAERIVVELPPAGQEIGRERYLDRLWEARRGFMTDEIKIGSFRQAHFLLNRMEENNDDLRGVHFLRGEAIRLGGLEPFYGPESDEWKAIEKLEKDALDRRTLEAAVESYEAAVAVSETNVDSSAHSTALRPIPVDVFKSIGIAKRRLGDPAGAVAALERYLEAAPNADDKTIIEFMIEELSGV